MAATDYTHVLYYNTFSICSIMARLSCACRGEAKDPKDEIVLKEQLVEIFKQEQLTEHYLCDVNVFGEVPVLAPVNGKPIPDSVVLTFHLAKLYPTLAPEQHAKEIERLVKKLHEINFFSLSFRGRPQSAQANLKFLEERLGENISQRYREALEIKVKRVQETKAAALTDESLESNIERAKAYMAELEAILKDSPTGWCFGLPQPSALDVHLVVFLARMRDIGYRDLIPDPLKQWAEKFMQRKEWTDVMQERRTFPEMLLR